MTLLGGDFIDFCSERFSYLPMAGVPEHNKSLMNTNTNQYSSLLFPQFQAQSSGAGPLSTGSWHRKDAKPASSIVVEDGKLRIRIAIQNIIFVRAEHVYCGIHFCNDQRIIQRGSLTSLAKQLPADGFMRVHRSYLVNLAWVEQWTKEELIIGKHRIPVARSRRREVFARLKARTEKF
jgi:DNA-binding LytR/AlgR family response regulator